MNAQEHLLTCLAEECGEVAKECSKAMRFGLGDVNVLHPEGPDNRQRIIDELNDLLGVVSMLEAANILPANWQDVAAQSAKQLKVGEFMTYAVKKGTLQIPKPHVAQDPER